MDVPKMEPRRTKPRKLNVLTTFHGGCHGCTSQIWAGIERCKGCKYYNADWNKPNLFTDYSDPQYQLHQRSKELVDNLNNTIERINKAFQKLSDCLESIEKVEGGSNP